MTNMKKRNLQNVIGLIFLVCSLFVSKAQVIFTIAGKGAAGFSGDGGPALMAEFQGLKGLASDPAGNIYIADVYNHRIRKVNISGIISTFAGNGALGFSGDGGAATLADLNYPVGVATDGSGNVFIADEGNGRIRKVDVNGIISTVAGTGNTYGGDGGPATSAGIGIPESVCLDGSGNMFIGDWNGRVRKVNTSGIITTVAGGGTPGFIGDGGPATLAELKSVSGVAVDNAGNLYISDEVDRRVRKVNASGIISTFAGDGTSGFSGDNGSATLAKLQGPKAVSTDASGNIYISDYANMRVRKVNSAGIITTFAGGGTVFPGDGNLATNVQIAGPQGTAIDGSGNIYITDYVYRCVRKVCNSNCITGIQLLETANKFRIYPNPNNGIFILELDREIENGLITLINSVGQKVFEQNAVPGANKIQISGLANGLYYCILKNDLRCVSTSKLTIE